MRATLTNLSNDRFVKCGFLYLNCDIINKTKNDISNGKRRISLYNLIERV